jgi:hypothetical protein
MKGWFWKLRQDLMREGTMPVAATVACNGTLLRVQCLTASAAWGDLHVLVTREVGDHFGGVEKELGEVRLHCNDNTGHEACARRIKSHCQHASSKINCKICGGHATSE